MKLNKKVTYIQFIITLIVVPLAVLIMFISFKYFLEIEIDKKLISNEKKISNLIKNGYLSFKISPFAGYSIVSESLPNSQNFENEVLYDSILKEKHLFRSLTTIKNIDGTNYSIYVKHSLVETKNLIYVMLMTILVFLIFTTLIFQTLFWKIQSKIWKPFYSSIEKLKKFSLGDDTIPVFEISDINEFNALNEDLTFMTNKIKADYLSLKEYSENAAHETQTPLAIIQLELEEIMQAEMSEEISKRIYKVYQSSNKLSLLTEKLLLLTKIENFEFNKLKEINFTELLLAELEKLDLLLKEKNITISVQIKNDFFHKTDAYLASILIDNLLSNAIKHNYKNGEISVQSNINFLTIKNTFSSSVNIDEIFNRFYKNNVNSDSLGLGLSITKRIVDLSNLSITALSDKNEMTFTISKAVLPKKLV